MGPSCYPVSPLEQVLHSHGERYSEPKMELPIYLMHDQPTTCPMCGKRTHWTGEDSQLHNCQCGYLFLVEEDEDFGLVETEHGWVPNPS